jgi:hypothetical protein
MAARDKAIADAFARVVVCASYCDRWITDKDFVRIIACEHDLLASDDTLAFDVLMLNKALRVDIRFKGADDTDGREAGTVGTVFRKDYSPSVSGSTIRRKVFCYYIGKKGHPPKPIGSQKWSDDIVSFPLILPKQCDIVVEQAKMLRKAFATTTPAKRKAGSESKPKAKELAKDPLSETKESAKDSSSGTKDVAKDSLSETKVISTHCIAAAIHPVETKEIAKDPLSERKAIATHCVAAAIHPPFESVVPPSPFTMSQLVRKPRLSGPVLSARSGPSRMEWDTGDGLVDTRSRKIRRIATDFEDTLKIDAGNDIATAGAILSNLVRRPSMSEVRTILTNELTNDESSLEAKMATCIQSFFKHHASKGPRKKCEQDALDAVLVACSFGDVPAASVASRLGAFRLKVQEC